MVLIDGENGRFYEQWPGRLSGSLGNTIATKTGCCAMRKKSFTANIDASLDVAASAGLWAAICAVVPQEDRRKLVAGYKLVSQLPISGSDSQKSATIEVTYR